MSGSTTPGASRLQAPQLQERSATMQRLHGSRGNHDSASGISTDTLRSSDFSGAITRPGSLRVSPEVTFVASPQQTEDQASECPYCGHRHWPGVHTCADCCMNAPPNLKPGREFPSSSESASTSPALTYDFMKSPDPKIIVAADAKKPTETVAARAFSLAESNFWLRNLKIRDYEALFARTIEDTNHPHLFNHDTPLGTAPKSRKRSITSQKATIWPFFAIFPSENTFYLVPRGCGSIKGVPWNHLTISKT